MKKPERFSFYKRDWVGPGVGVGVEAITGEATPVTDEAGSGVSAGGDVGAMP